MKINLRNYFSPMIFVLLTMLSTSSFGSFKSTHKRYMAPYDILLTWKNIFPLVYTNVHLVTGIAFPIPDDDSLPTIFENVNTLGCLIISSDKNSSVLGTNQPISGKSLYQEPSAAFVRWYTECIPFISYWEEKLSKDLEEGKLREDFKKRFLGEFAPRSKENWKKLNTQEKVILVQARIRTLIGPTEVITDLGVHRDEMEIVGRVLNGLKRLEEDKNLLDASIKATYLIMLMDEFLTY